MASITASEHSAETGPRELAGESLFGSLAIMLILTVVQRGVGFLRGILFCRWLDSEQLGQWDIALGFLMFAAPLAVLGLPGSFGRYVEHYRQRGQLKTFLRRTTFCTVVMSLVALSAMLLARSWFSELIFGSPDYTNLVLLLTFTLTAVIGYNYLLSLITGLRQYRLASAMQFSSSLLFATVGCGLMWIGQPQTSSVVTAFGIAYFVTVIFVFRRLVPLWRELPKVSQPLSHHSLWSKLVPFAFWMWVTNWVYNLFELTDRVMIVHYSGLSPDDALQMVGQYHSARVLPLLFVSIADLVCTTITPHLSSDWEAGRRDRVGERLRFSIKLIGAFLSVAAAGTLIVSPLLFEFALEGKYRGGESVLPLALACSIWTGMMIVTNNYLWCAEKSRFVSLTQALGLALNIALNLLLLPRFGLLGAVASAAVSRSATLGLLWLLVRKQGMHIDRGLLIIGSLPLLLPLGPWVMLGGCALAIFGVLPGLACFSAGEQSMLADHCLRGWSRIKSALGWENAATAP
jgi:PST family polysaccharide transporter